MKTAGIIMIVLGIMALIWGLVAADGKSIGGGITWIVIGAFLVHMGNKKKTHKEEKDKWESGK